MTEHQLASDEAMKIRFASKRLNAAPVGAVDYTNTTDQAGLRIDMALGGGAA